MTPDEYLEWIIPSAKLVCEQYELPWQVVVAQGAIESSWGNKGIGNGNFNIFGRKWGEWGEYVEVVTEECYNGVWETITDKFQSYNSLEEAIKDWCILISEEPLYIPCYEIWKLSENIPAFVESLASIYATDPEYANKVLTTIKACELE